MLEKNAIKVFDHIFPQKVTLTFLEDHSLTPCIVNAIKSEIRYKPTNFQRPISVEERLMLTLR
jgi:hypothetical protein